MSSGDHWGDFTINEVNDDDDDDDVYPDCGHNIKILRTVNIVRRGRTMFFTTQKIFAQYLCARYGSDTQIGKLKG